MGGGAVSVPVRARALQGVRQQQLPAVRPQQPRHQRRNWLHAERLAARALLGPLSGCGRAAPGSHTPEAPVLCFLMSLDKGPPCEHALASHARSDAGTRHNFHT